jgi:hypothetical protein
MPREAPVMMAVFPLSDMMSSLWAPAARGADSCTRMNIYVMKNKAVGFRFGTGEDARASII